ncbi:hypothetical protein N7489_008144 [Penicillium chrysogenum]|jgi:hypothetical protein|uniref:DUF7136 domain-containing protein n=1 Tax=Penicillium chrysogenum TaxID=5076 RepID=A0ABQ8WB65_PENCH|nr:uncharacterized protein N7489_008144 [Penicillium chrysogenum]KAJ5238053.1 hypothetical protein N7489_008144 [Penicillium chrysogenum]KAJ5261692.1 hypothetical protein N7505_008559 [Penicillium chrysogenum]
MSIVSSILLLCFGFRAAVAATPDLSNPVGIELDVVFPRNTTYNNMTTPPIVFALQNAPTAVFFEYRLDWELNSDDAHFFLAGSFDEINYFKKFNHTSGTTALLVDSAYWDQRLDAGTYTLSWSYTTTTCDDKGDSTLIRTGDVAAGELYFTVVNDGSGSKLSFTECPEYLGNITAKSASDSCPSLIHRGGEPQPCDAKLKEKQVKCLGTYFEGQTDVDACEAGFDDIKAGDKVEWKYANQTRNAHSHTSDSAINSSGSSRNVTTEEDTSSSGQSSSDDMESTNELGDSKDVSVGNTYRSHLGFAVVATLVVGMLFS